MPGQLTCVKAAGNWRAAELSAEAVWAGEQWGQSIPPTVVALKPIPKSYLWWVVFKKMWHLQQFYIQHSISHRQCPVPPQIWYGRSHSLYLCDCYCVTIVDDSKKSGRPIPTATHRHIQCTYEYVLYWYCYPSKKKKVNSSYSANKNVKTIWHYTTEPTSISSPSLFSFIHYARTPFPLIFLTLLRFFGFWQEQTGRSLT